MSKPGGRENNFNLVRLVLASAVILGHSPELVDGDRNREVMARNFGDWVTLGVLAVDGFFLLSGYLIAQSWESDPRLLAFIRKRAARIYPGFVAACLICALLVGPMGDNPDYWARFRPWAFLKGLLVLHIPVVPTPFLIQPYSQVAGPLWTVRYEFAAYLGLAALGLVGVLRHRRIVLILACLLAISAAAHAGGAVASTRIAGVSVANISRLASFFLAGAAFYKFRDLVRFKRGRVLAAALLLLPALSIEWCGAIALPALGGYLLLAAGSARPLGGTAVIRQDDLSYGLYLYAWPIQQLIICRHPGIDPWVLSAITFALGSVAGSLSWRLIERPAIRWARSARRDEPARSPRSVVALLAPGQRPSG